VFAVQAARLRRRDDLAVGDVDLTVAVDVPDELEVEVDGIVDRQGASITNGPPDEGTVNR